MERNNAWLRELIGRLSNGPSDFDTTPTLAPQAKVSAVRLGRGADDLFFNDAFSSREPVSTSRHVRGSFR
jgi:hypothetical protein